jgi:anti-sigma factor ChrR (cupin superfamily)
MIEDCTRRMVVMKLICADCKEILRVGYEQHDHYASGEPTGAHSVSNTVRVYPCDRCRRESDEAKKALDTLAKFARPSIPPSKDH